MALTGLHTIDYKIVLKAFLVPNLQIGNAYSNTYNQ